MRRIICILLASLLLPTFSRATLAQRGSVTIASSLRCEYLNDPLAIDAHQPRLSWRIEGTARGAAQTAYHILVSASEVGLAANTGDLWDTGKINSHQTIQIAYEGKPLQSRQQCFWKVRV